MSAWSLSYAVHCLMFNYNASLVSQSDPQLLCLGISLVSHCPMVIAWFLSFAQLLCQCLSLVLRVICSVMSAWFLTAPHPVNMSGHKPGFSLSYVQLLCHPGFPLSYAQLICQGISLLSHCPVLLKCHCKPGSSVS